MQNKQTIKNRLTVNAGGDYDDQLEDVVIPKPFLFCNALNVLN